MLSEYYLIFVLLYDLLDLYDTSFNRCNFIIKYTNDYSILFLECFASICNKE